jgi:hypothetical protein
MQSTNSVTFTVTNPTKEQLAVILKALKGAKNEMPLPTVSDEEDANFGRKPLTKKDLKAKDEEEEAEEVESDDDHDEEETEEEENDNDSEELTFDEVKTALTKLGGQHPAKAEAVLKSFGFPNLKELKIKPNKWEAVYKKTKGVLATLKKLK